MEPLFKYFLFITGGGTFLFFISKLIIKYSFDAIINVQKIELEKQRDIHIASLEKANSEFKSKLDLIFEKSTRIYDRRLKVITSTYSKMIKFEDDMLHLTRQLKFYNPNKVEQAKIEHDELIRAAESFNILSIYYRQNKLFFTEELSKKMDSAIKLFHDILFNHEQSKNATYGPEFQYELYKENRNKIEKELPALKSDIEVLFKRLLALEEKLK